MTFMEKVRGASKLGLFLVSYSLPLVVMAQQGSYTVTNPLGAGSSFCSLIKDILSAAMTIGVPISILIIVYAGFKFVTAQGNAGELGEARQNFFWTVIGILIFFGAAVIADVIIGTLQVFQVPIASCN